MSDRYDVIIIGTGAGGGTLARHLAPTGKRILLLERGGFVPREPANWSSREAVRNERYHAPETWLDGDGRAFRPGTHYNVGGNTKFYGAALFRMRERDFGELRHADGVSPAWPISYAELEPYYLLAEQRYEVHGARGVDPTEPWASGDYPFPEVAHEPRIAELAEHFRREGLRPFHVPLGVRLLSDRLDASPCIRCRWCDGYPCLVHGKADAETMGVRPALRRENVTLLTGALVQRLETSACGGAVTAAVVAYEGRTERFEADLFVVACGAVNSAALLLRSANSRHPNGLANGSGAVGRHYMCHNNSVLFHFSARRNDTSFQKTLALNDFYFGGGHAPFPLGHVSMVGKMDGQMFKAGAPRIAPVPLLEAMSRRSLDFWITSEDLPRFENRVSVEPDGRIRVDYRANNLEAHRRLVRTLEGLLRRFEGGRSLTKGAKIPLAGVAHQCGTIRFGRDRELAPLDVDCKAHELDNLYVVDASFFPSSSAVNPALTIMANALRVGDRLCERMGAIREADHDDAVEHRLPVLA